MRTGRRTAAGLAALAAMAVGFSLATATGAMAAGQTSGAETGDAGTALVEDSLVNTDPQPSFKDTLTQAWQGVLAAAEPTPYAAGQRREGQFIWKNDASEKPARWFWIGEGLEYAPGKEVNYAKVEDGGLAKAQARAWTISIPAFNEWGKIRFESGPYKGQCLQATRSTIASYPKQDLQNGVWPATCSSGVNVLQDFLVLSNGYVLALKDDPGVNQPFLNVGVGSLGMGQAAALMVSNQSSTQYLETLYDVSNWKPITPEPPPPVEPGGEYQISLAVNPQTQEAKLGSDQVTFTYTVTNHTPTTVGKNGEMMKWDVKAFDSNNSPVTSLTCKRNDTVNIAAGSSVTCTGTYQVSAAERAAGKRLDFTARATAYPLEWDPKVYNVDSNWVDFYITLPALLNLSLTKDGPKTVRKGEQIEWTLTVKNEGTTSVDGFVIEDKIPNTVKVTGVTGATSVANGDVLTLTSTTPILAGGQATVKVAGTVKASSESSAPACGAKITNRAEIMGSINANKAAEHTIDSVICDSVTLTKTINGRANAEDEFTIQLLDGLGGELQNATTDSDSLTEPNSASIELVDRIVPGQGFAVAEKAAVGSGADLENYAAELVCTRSDTGAEISHTAAHESDRLRWELVMPGFKELPPQETRIACELTNTSTAAPTPLESSLSWSKEDGSNSRLAGSVWTLTNDTTGTAFAVEDCVEDDASKCTGQDKNPLPGEFLVEGLEPDEYTLVEAMAPAGFVLDATDVGFELDGTQTAVAIGPKGLGDTDAFINHPQAVAALPLTGVFSQPWVWVGGVLTVGLLLAVTLWMQNPRRKVG